MSLDGQEAELIFIDHPSNEMSVSRNDCDSDDDSIAMMTRSRTSSPHTSPRPAWSSTRSLTRRATSRPRRLCSIWRHRRENLESEERKYWYLPFFYLRFSNIIFKVGNKVDLERSRQVATSEGKELARSYDAKFIETSAGLKHNVDELLVGVLKQILLRQESSENPPRVKVHI